MRIESAVGVAALATALTLGLTVPTAGAGGPERRAEFHPTLKASKASVMAGGGLVLSGKVRPGTNGGVVLQKRVGDRKKWVVEARLKVSSRGTYVYRDKPTTAGIRWYRVVAPKAGNVKAGVSRSVEVGVYRWQSLAWSGQRAHLGTYHSKQATIDGTEYGHSFTGVAGYDEGFIDFNLDRACLRVETRYGNGDASDADAIAHISVVADGASVYAKSFALAESEVKTFDIRGVFRLSFDWTSTNPSGTPEDQSGAAALFVEPRVLCAY